MQKQSLYIDEVGVGAWAGPLVVCGIYGNEQDFDWIGGDSKKLDRRSRQKIYDILVRNFDYELVIISSDLIDKINILEARRLGIKMLMKDEKETLIDGNKILNEGIFIVDGDEKVSGIAAASILAKVYRDSLMAQLPFSKLYRWDKNVGYVTKEHISLVEEHGLSNFHRLSWKTSKNFQVRNNARKDALVSIFSHIKGRF